jgi:hypothetical protein
MLTTPTGDLPMPAQAPTRTLAPLADTLARLRERLATRALADSLNPEPPAAPAPDRRTTPAVSARPPSPRREGTVIALPAAIERMQQQLLALEIGADAMEVIERSNAFPTFLARLPLFVPGKRSRQPHETDDGLLFKTSWGEGKRHGPALTVFDEDTLIALCRLRQVAINAEGARLPVPIGTNDRQRVHALRTTVRAVQAECGGASSCGGTNLRRRLESIQRLAAQRIALSQTTADKLGRTGSTFSLIELAWLEHPGEPHEDTDGDDCPVARRRYAAEVYVQFPPTMAKFLDSCYSYIDWNVRLQLTDTGKAIHRFLSSQPEDYVISTELLRRTIGYPRAYAFFMRDLRGTMERLVDLRWVRHWRLVPLTGASGERRHKLELRRR